MAVAVRPPYVDTTVRVKDGTTIVIGGLITSTLLTLVIVPVAYTIIDAIAERTLGHATVMREGEETPLEAVARHA